MAAWSSDPTPESMPPLKKCIGEFRGEVDGEIFFEGTSVEVEIIFTNLHLLLFCTDLISVSGNDSTPPPGFPEMSR